MDPRPGTRVTDKVTLVEPLGEGAMGSVWLADHRTLETRVAVKFIATELIGKRLDAAQRFSREATAAAQIRSPHVVQMIDHGLTDDGTPYMVMELLEGESLEELLERGGPLSLQDTAAIVRQVAKALTAAHALGVVHRDIKPHNIFLMDAAGETFVKVLDFGIAKRTRVASGQEITEPGMIVGTPQYVSRDLIMGGGQAPITARVDLWSLAVVAYKCLTKALPFDGDSLGAICTALAAGRFAPPSAHQPELSPRVDRWFERAFAEDPKARFADAAELADSFERLLDESGGSARPAAPRPAPTMRSQPPQPTPWWGRLGRRKLLALVAISGLLVGAGLALALRGLPLAPRSHTGGPATSRTGRVPADTPSGVRGNATAPSGEASSGAPGTAVGAAASGPALAPAGSASVAVNPPRAPRAGEAFIPAGSVWRGCDVARDRACKDDEKPGALVKLGAFYIDRTEVTVSQYGHCVLAGRCSDRRVKGLTDRKGAFLPSTSCNWEHPGRARHPMNCVSQPQAAGYCAWIGGRLPTEAEWERAARGDGRRLHPWGDGPPSCALLVMADEGDKGCGRGSTWAAGSKRTDKSAFGLFDMGGNVREWLADWYAADYYRAGPTTDPQGPTRGRWRVTHGGSWGSALPRTLRTSARFPAPPNARSIYLGFRCARSAG